MLAQRHSWVWAVLAPDHGLVWCDGDSELAEFLREAGLRVVEGRSASAGSAEGPPPGAVLISAEGEAAVSAASRAGATLRGSGGLVAIPVGGGNPTVTGTVSRPLRALRLAGSPLTAISAELAARRIARAMRRSGLDVSRVPTGERARLRYGLGRGGWFRRARLPVGSIVVGKGLEREPSVAEAATDRAAQALGGPVRRRSTDVFATGKLALQLTGPGGPAYYLWVAAGTAREELNRRGDAVRAILRGNAPPPVRDRIVEPITTGRVGPADYVLEPKVPGRHPVWMTPRLWHDCLEFLTALHRLPLQEPTLALSSSWPNLESGTEFLVRHVGPEERSLLERVHDEITDRVGGVPVGGGHGDFWRENLIVRRGRLRAVVDWEWAAVDSLPLLDLLDLIGQFGWGRRRGLDPGRTFSEVLWPLAKRGGDERIRLYCAETGTPCDVRTLEGLAMAHWLLRTARDGLVRVERVRSRRWFADNILIPLTHMRAALEAPRGARPEPPPSIQGVR